jgi:hypothetical protein
MSDAAAELSKRGENPGVYAGRESDMGVLFPPNDGIAGYSTTTNK